MEETEAATVKRRRRRPTPDHPPYSEMVQCAIRALAEKHGSTEPAISAYIRAHYESLPWAHSRLLPYYLRKLLLAGELSNSSSFPNRFILPKPLHPNPSPQPNESGPRKRRRGRPRNPFPKPLPLRPLVKLGRGRPRKLKLPETEPNLSPVFTQPVDMERPRLILRLKRSGPIRIDGDGAVVAGGYWHCLRVGVDGHDEEVNDEMSDACDESLSASEKDDSDGLEWPASQEEEDFDGVTIDDHNVETLALSQERDLNGIGTDELNGEVLASQENDLNDTETDGHRDFDGIMIDEHDGGTLVSLEKDLNGTGSDKHDGEMLASQENELNGIDNDGHKGFDGIMIDEHDGGALVSQEKNLNDIGSDEHNGKLLAMQENELDAIETGGHNEEMLELQVVPDAESCKPGSDQGRPSKKAKPKKSRRLWYEG